MKLKLAILLTLKLVLCDWAVAIADPVDEETALSLKQLLSKDLASEETGTSLRNVCNETLTATSGAITSPNFPQAYESNSNCYWLIVGSTGTIINLNFDSFVVEAGVDFLQVYDGSSVYSPSLANYTGYSTPPGVSSTGNFMLLYFTTNAINQYAGFSARYSTVFVGTTSTTLPPIPECGSTLMDSGYIQSPAYPFPYPSNSNCTWYLQSSSPTSISLRFDLFLTEAKIDYVAVYSGWDTYDKDPVLFSGNLATPFSYNTTATNKLTVRFISDPTTELAGFKAYFS